MPKNSVYAYGKSEEDRLRAIKKADHMAKHHKVSFFVGFGSGTFGGYIIANELICKFVYEAKPKVSKK
ncbi:MAG: hypothetical protein ACRYGG_18230 [Janthinobacterium lividum]